MKNNSDYKNELFVPFIFFDKQPCHKINYDTHYQNDNMLRISNGDFLTHILLKLCDVLVLELREGITIGVQCDFDVCVSEELLKNLCRHSCLDASRCIGMSEGVKRDLPCDGAVDYAVFLQSSLELTVHLTR